LESTIVLSTYNQENFIASRIEAQDDLLFVIEEGVGLHILDVSDLLNLQHISTVYLNITSYDDIVPRNNYVYVAAGGDEGILYVIDISEPSKPRIISEVEYPDFFTSIVADDEFIYIVTSWDLITVFDIQNPENPRLISTHDSENFLEDIHLEKGELYIALRYGGGIASVELESP